MPTYPSNLDPQLFRVWLENNSDCNMLTISQYVFKIATFCAENSHNDLESLETFNQYLIRKCIRGYNYPDYGIIKHYIRFKFQDRHEIMNRLLNGLIKIKRKDPKTSRRVLTDEEQFMVINNMSQDRHQLLAIMQNLTGARIGDLIRLKIGSIFEEKIDGMPALRIDIVGKSQRRVVKYIFDEAVISLIKRYIAVVRPEYDNYLFMVRSRMNRTRQYGEETSNYLLTYNLYRNDLCQAMIKSGMNPKDFSTHDFRRAFARKVWNKYRDVTILQSAMGHRHIQTSLAYLRFSGLSQLEVYKSLYADSQRIEKV